MQNDKPIPKFIDEEIIEHFCQSMHTASHVINLVAQEKGFWDTPNRNVGEMLMLVVTELAEAMEGHRTDAKDDHLPQFDSLSVEIADAIIRLLDISAGLNLNVADALFAKFKYNKSRPYKHGKKC